jgi:hypothetical protein
MPNDVSPRPTLRKIQISSDSSIVGAGKTLNRVYEIELTANSCIARCDSKNDVGRSATCIR